MEIQVAVLYGNVPASAPADEQDVLTEVEAVSQALTSLGYEPVPHSISLDIESSVSALKRLKPAFAFNLVESIEGKGGLIHVAPSILNYLKIPFTGAPTEAMFLTSNKLLSKSVLKNSGVTTPNWFDFKSQDEISFNPPYIAKSNWEHGSVGIDEHSIIYDKAAVKSTLKTLHKERLGDFFLESYIDGREFNISLLGGTGGKEPQVLPYAEIRFIDFQDDKPKIVGYRAKWDSDSFEYVHTQRSFDFVNEDAILLEQLGRISRKCWAIFGLRGYARVDFRVDRYGTPFVLEVNANPCISKDAGFFAAAQKIGLSYEQVIDRIIKDSIPKKYWKKEALPLAAKITQAPSTTETQPLRRRALRSSDISYRDTLNTGDRDKIFEIVNSSGFFSEEEKQIAVELVDEFLQKGKESGYCFIVAEHKGKVIGYSCFGRIPGSDVSFDLYWIAVHNDFRGLGAGKKILAKTEEEIQNMGGKNIFIDTSGRPQYEPTQIFYTSCGYEEAAVLKNFYSLGDDKIIFAKTLQENLSK